jgi:hypothetical protein
MSVFMQFIPGYVVLLSVSDIFSAFIFKQLTQPYFQG